jgi:menaquinone-dependent protoporphyrinogen oxidase
MDIQVLVAYATKYGATAEIAEKIGHMVRQAGLRTDVLSTDRVSDLTPYGAVVLGSAVYAGQWRKEATTFLEANQKKLAERPVWLFSSGPTGEGDPVQLMKGWRFPEAQQSIADRIRPRDIAFFHGVLDMKKQAQPGREADRQGSQGAGWRFPGLGRHHFLGRDHHRCAEERELVTVQRSIQCCRPN